MGRLDAGLPAAARLTLVLLFDIPVYRPWSLFAWWYHYEAYAPEVFDRVGTLAAASGFVSCASAVFGSLWRARQSAQVTTYGSARWATKGEIGRAGLFDAAGVFLGRLDGRYLRHDGPEHVMASRRRARAKASASSSRHCCPGPAPRSSMTSRARTGH